MKLTTISLMVTLALGLCAAPLSTEAQQVGQGTATIREGTYEGGRYRIQDARSPETDPVFADVTGRITVPMLTLHNTGDARVPFSVEQDYRRKTIAAGTDHLLVQCAIRWPGHCNAHISEEQQAFDDLVGWIERGISPDGDDVLAADLSNIGLRWTRIPHPDDPARQPIAVCSINLTTAAQLGFTSSSVSPSTCSHCVSQWIDSVLPEPLGLLCHTLTGSIRSLQTNVSKLQSVLMGTGCV